MKIKMIASDLDGTIVRDNNTISECSIKAIQDAIEHGIRFLPCTGRSYEDYRSAFPKNCRTHAILLNGALFVDEYGKKILSSSLDLNQAKQIEEILLAHGMPCLYFSENTIYGTGDIKELTNCMNSYYTDCEQVEYFSVPIQYIHTVHDVKENILKMESMHTDQARLISVKEILYTMHDLQVSSSLPFNLEITAGGVNKASMLQKVLAFYHIKEDELLYFGDSNNDVEVFKEFSNTVAVENAIDEIKALASETCKCCEEDGVASYIKEKVSQIA